jgi:hypothetical protein
MDLLIGATCPRFASIQGALSVLRALTSFLLFPFISLYFRLFPFICPLFPGIWLFQWVAHGEIKNRLDFRSGRRVRRRAQELGSAYVNRNDISPPSGTHSISARRPRRQEIVEFCARGSVGRSPTDSRLGPTSVHKTRSSSPSGRRFRTRSRIRRRTEGDPVPPDAHRRNSRGPAENPRS